METGMDGSEFKSSEQDERYKSSHVRVTGTFKAPEEKQIETADLAQWLDDKAEIKAQKVFNIILKDPKPGNLKNEIIVGTFTTERVANAYCKLLNVSENRIRYTKREGFVLIRPRTKDGKELIFHINPKPSEMSDEKKVVEKIRADGRSRLLSDEQWELLNKKRYGSTHPSRSIKK